MPLIPIQQAAEALGVSRQYIQKLITAERIHAKRLGKAWFLESRGLRLPKAGKRGRPKTKSSVAV